MAKTRARTREESKAKEITSTRPSGHFRNKETDRLSIMSMCGQE